MNPELFFNRLKSHFHAASKRTGQLTRSIEIGTESYQMNFSGGSLVPVFFNAFRHLEAPFRLPDLTLNFWDSESSGIPIGEIPWRDEQPDHLGLITSFTDSRFFTLQQPGSDAIYMLDKESAELYYWVSSPDRIPVWESDFPLRMVFHWWLKDTSFQPVHAAAVGTEEGGVLMAGKGGSGKSTATMSCIYSDLKIAGDDYVLLDCDQIKVHSLFCLTKLDQASAKRLMIERVARHYPLIDDKYRIMLWPDYSESLIRTMPLRAVLLPTITSADITMIEPCSAADAMLALAPTTLFQLPGLHENSFRKIGSFLKNVPSFRLLLGKDTQSLPMILSHFLATYTTIPQGIDQH